MRKPRRRRDGTFAKGRSGNPAGRPQGSTNRAKERRQLEEEGIELACNALDVAEEVLVTILSEARCDERIVQLITPVLAAVKDQVHDGHIGPSAPSKLRFWYDACFEDGDNGLLEFIGLPSDCSWEEFRRHYTTASHADYERHVGDLMEFPPIKARTAELKAEAGKRS